MLQGCRLPEKLYIKSRNPLHITAFAHLLLMIEPFPHKRYAFKQTNKTKKSLRFGDFFDNQSWHWIPACISVCVSISGTISNVDTNTDSSLVDVFTVAFYCSRSVVIFIRVSDPDNRVNGQRTIAFCTIKGDEPALTTLVTTHVYITLINHS